MATKTTKRPAAPRPGRDGAGLPAMDLGGVPVRLLTDDGAALRLARGSYRRWRGAAGGRASAPVALRLRRVARFDGGGRPRTGAGWRRDGRGFEIASRWFRLRVSAGGRRADAVASARFGLADLFRPVTGALLAARDGLLLHSAALEIPGAGVCLFSGASGHGKTTLARLAPPRAVLADDAVGIRIVRDAGRGTRDVVVLAHPTPFFGDYGRPPAGLRPGGRAVRGLFLLGRPSRKTARHAVERVGPGEAAAAILSQVLVPGDAPPEIRARLLGRAAAMATALPVYRLAFVRDRSVWGYLMRIARDL